MTARNLPAPSALDASYVQASRLTPLEAIRRACLLRFRPILMTTMAALLAGLPLALGTGIGSELRRPLGITMVGGLLLSQALTLYTTPVIYIFFDRLSQRFGHKPSGDEGPDAGESDQGALAGNFGMKLRRGAGLCD